MRNNNELIGTPNYKLLIRNLRNAKHEKLKIQTTGTNIKFEKVRESVRIQGEIKPGHR